MKLLRQALAVESAQSQPAAAPADSAQIQMKGPLADIYSQALAVAYAKDQGKQEDLAAAAEAPDHKAVTAVLESQQMDVTLMQELAKLVDPSNGQANPAAADVVYAVSDQGVSEDDVVEVARGLVQAPPGERGQGDFILIVDGTVPGPNGESAGSEPQEKMQQLGAALESMVQAFGKRVYHSLGEYLSARKKR